jgi:hypothetical protein
MTTEIVVNRDFGLLLGLLLRRAGNFLPLLRGKNIQDSGAVGVPDLLYFGLLLGCAQAAIVLHGSHFLRFFLEDRLDLCLLIVGEVQLLAERLKLRLHAHTVGLFRAHGLPGLHSSAGAARGLRRRRETRRS